MNALFDAARTAAATELLDLQLPDLTAHVLASIPPKAVLDEVIVVGRGEVLMVVSTFDGDLVWGSPAEVRSEVVYLTGYPIGQRVMHEEDFLAAVDKLLAE